MGNNSKIKYGDIFGIWKCLEDESEKYIKCQCCCENKTIKMVSKYHLKNGSSTNCGCKRKESLSVLKSKTNKYDLSGDYGIGWTSNTNEEFYFDLEDYNKIKDFCWYSCKYKNYKRLCSNYKNKIIKFHNLVYNNGKITDHKNRNTLDNRKENLRKATYLQNASNSSIAKNNKSGVIGVHYNKRDDLWVSQIGINGRNIHLINSKNKNTCIIKRLEAEIEYFGKEFSPQRHLFEKYGILKEGGSNINQE